MNSNEDINGLLARHFASERLTPRQQSALNSWIKANGEEYARLKKLMSAPVAVPDPSAFDAGRAWSKIEPRLGGSPRSRVALRRVLLAASVAASLLLAVVLVLPYLSDGSSNEVLQYANNEAAERHILLPDSSEVVLYPDASLAFSTKSSDKVRLARLRGKAFFKVKKQHGASFKVETGIMNVVVMGTSFLVDAADSRHAGVYVKTGKVKVTTSRESVLLEKNEKAELIDGRMRSGIIASPQDIFGQSEPDVSMVFTNEPVGKVVKEIENNTGIRIELADGLDGNLITTRIDKADGHDIAEELAFVCGCKYRTVVAGRHYILYK